MGGTAKGNARHEPGQRPERWCDECVWGVQKTIVDEAEEEIGKGRDTQSNGDETEFGRHGEAGREGGDCWELMYVDLKVHCLKK